MPPESTGAPFANHLLRVLSNRSDVISELLPARVGRDLVLLGRGNPVLLAPEICLELFRLSACPVVSRSPYQKPLSWRRMILIATRLDPRGAVETAVAGQMAIPRLFRPVLFQISCSLTTGL